LSKTEPEETEVTHRCPECRETGVALNGINCAQCGTAVEAADVREVDPDDAEPRDYLRAVEGGSHALHVTLSDDKEWWLAHNPDKEPPGTFNGPWLHWSTYPSGPWELQFQRRDVMFHILDELYYVDYHGEENHSVHEATLTPLEDAPEFVRGEFDAE